MRSLLFALALGASALPSAANAWWDEAWAYRKPVVIDTSAEGARVGERLARVPVLVRLDGAGFRFEDAKPDGSDIVFVGADDKTPLNFHIESFDPRTGLATVWVDVPEAAPNSQTTVWMYYGNPEAQAAGNAAETYDANYQMVLHFAGTGPVADATAFRNTVSANVTRAPGLAGQGARFDGSTFVALPSGQGLALDPARGFTFETWAKPAATGANGVVFSKRSGTEGLVVGFADGAPYVDVIRGGQTSRIEGGAAVGAAWTHLAVAADQAGVRLFVGGRQVGVSEGPAPALPAGGTLGGESGAAGFAGDLDEVRVSSTARAAAYFQAITASEGMGGDLVALGEDEEPGGHGGHMGVIIQSTPLDAWIVIGILAVMFLIAGVVMWTKAAYLGRVSKANRAFNEAYRRLGANIAGLKSAPEGQDPVVKASPLFAVYEAGLGELNEMRRISGGGSMSGEAIEAVRSSVDAVQVEQNQKLDAWMVLLTIAISGGPFIGLLGTVLGVMITFAAVAAAGDVNVNAIAPGIAAALLATVAGLAVAIPALFAYNYFNARISALSDQMRVFADRLITRLAEAQARNALPAAE